MYIELFEIISPIFICALIGFAWRKSDRTFDVATITDLITAIGTPCLIFSTLITVKVKLDSLTEMAIAAGVSTIGFGIIGYFTLKLMRLDHRIFLPATMFGNVGNMGLPLTLFAFGEPGLALGIIYFTVNVFLLFTLGPAIAIGSLSIHNLIRLPFIYAILGALFFLTLEIAVPHWLFTTTKLLGDMMIPLMLITLGVSLAQLQIKNIKHSLLISLTRLGGGIGVGLLTAEVFDFNNIEKGVLVLQSAMPVAVFAYLFAEKFGTQSEDVASSILVSTGISFLTLPVLLRFLL